MVKYSCFESFNTDVSQQIFTKNKHRTALKAMRNYGISDILDQKLQEIKMLTLKMRDLINKAGDRNDESEKDNLLAFESAINEFKARERELEEENTDLVKMNTELIRKIEDERNQFLLEHKYLEEQILLAHSEKEDLASTIAKISYEHQAINKDQNIALQQKIKDCEEQIKKKDTLIEELKSIYDKSVFEEKASAAECKLLQDKYSSLLSERDDLLTKLRSNESEISNLQNKSEDLLSENKSCKSVIQQLKAANQALKDEIRLVKGNISVICRLRPDFSPSTALKPTLLATASTISVSDHVFYFDHVLLPSTSQSSVYSQVSYMIDSVIKGYNATIFAYGQTGSGKTFTMEGNKTDPGIIPNALSELFSVRNSPEGEGCIFKIDACVFEIYNESIRDLLSVDATKCEIRHVDGETSITNCKKITLASFNDALETFAVATKNRSVGATECNQRSSRSHLIYHIQVECDNLKTKECTKGVLNMIDLAGSERLAESKSEGVRLKETLCINQSLSALGNVINSIVVKNSHVPFRSSKLTYFLQNYLSGKGLVTMIVNVSSSFKHSNETLCSLRFAEKVSRCSTGKQTKNVAAKI